MPKDIGLSAALASKGLRCATRPCGHAQAGAPFRLSAGTRWLLLKPLRLTQRGRHRWTFHLPEKRAGGHLLDRAARERRRRIGTENELQKFLGRLCRKAILRRGGVPMLRAHVMRKGGDRISKNHGKH
jgi:hypothetical protein